MSEWPMVKLGEVARVVAGGTPKTSVLEYWDGDIPWVTPKDLALSESLWINAGERFITDYGLAKSAAALLPRGTVLWSSRAPIGLVAIANNQIATNQGFKSFVPGGELDSEYLAYFLIHQRPILEMMGVGATFKEVSAKRAAEIMVPLPPLGEQKCIAEILGEVSKTIKDTEKIIHNVQGLKRSALRDILNNKSGEYVQLSQISSVQSGITKGRKVQDGITLMPTPYMAVSNVKAGYLDLSEVKQIDASEAEVNRYQLQAGDILLTEGGDPDKLGRGTIWRNEIPGAIHQNHIFRVRINPDSGFTSEALMAILESTESKGYFLRSAKQTTGISSINKRQLSATPIPVLGKVQVEELTNMWHKIDEVIELYHRKLSLLQELQKSLASRAFAGLL